MPCSCFAQLAQKLDVQFPKLRSEQEPADRGLRIPVCTLCFSVLIRGHKSLSSSKPTSSAALSSQSLQVSLSQYPGIVPATSFPIRTVLCWSSFARAIIISIFSSNNRVRSLFSPLLNSPLQLLLQTVPCEQSCAQHVPKMAPVLLLPQPPQQQLEDPPWAQPLHPHRLEKGHIPASVTVPVETPCRLCQVKYHGAN